MLILTFCDNATILNVMRIIKIVINIIRIAVPIILILSLMIGYVGAITSSDNDALSKMNKSVVSKCIAVIVIFLIPSFVKLLLDTTVPTSELSKCLENSNSEYISQLRDDSGIDAVIKAENSLNKNDYASAISMVKNVSDKTLKEELLERLKVVKEKIEESTQKTDSEKQN